MIDPLLISSAIYRAQGNGLLSMTMNEEKSIRAPCNMYTVFPKLTLDHSAYQAHPSANALHSVTINVLIA